MRDAPMIRIFRLAALAALLNEWAAPEMRNAATVCVFRANY